MLLSAGNEGLYAHIRAPNALEVEASEFLERGLLGCRQIRAGFAGYGLGLHHRVFLLLLECISFNAFKGRDQ